MFPKDEFLLLCERLDLINGEEIYTLLLDHYTDSNRYYHNLNHIIDGLKLLNSISEYIQKLDWLVFCWWFHDIIYDVHSKTSEEESAKLAQQLYLKYSHSKDEDAALWIYQGILSTQHQEKPMVKDHQYLCDVDLSILGQPPEKFDEYEINIRKEYSYLPMQRYSQGRVAILKKILSRNTIYFTEFFIINYEQQARLNLQRSISQLNG